MYTNVYINQEDMEYAVKLFNHSLFLIRIKPEVKS